jgi:hypothetical protein
MRCSFAPNVETAHARRAKINRRKRHFAPNAPSRVGGQGAAPAPANRQGWGAASLQLYFTRKAARQQGRASGVAVEIRAQASYSAEMSLPV